MSSRFDTIPERDRRTDRRTEERIEGQNCYINIARQLSCAARDNKVMLKVQALQGAAHIVSAVGAFIFLLYFT